jgi:hypothetical protein
MMAKKTSKKIKTSTETDGDFELTTRIVKRKNRISGMVEDHKVTVATRKKPKAAQPASA